jgi:hypothetical protein
MKKRELVPGDVVQLNPEVVKNPALAACFMTVTEVKDWGAMGYVEACGSAKVVTVQGAAYYRAAWDEMEYIGHAEWKRDDESR